MDKEIYLERPVEWAEKKSTISLKSISEGYENPQIFISKTTQEEIQADLSFVTHGGVKHYSVVALKNENPKKTVAKSCCDFGKFLSQKLYNVSSCF